MNERESTALLLRMSHPRHRVEWLLKLLKTDLRSAGQDGHSELRRDAQLLLVQPGMQFTPKRSEVDRYQYQDGAVMTVPTLKVLARVQAAVQSGLGRLFSGDVWELTNL